MQGFIKSANSVSSQISYRGYEKAAVFLAELADASEKVMNALSLTVLEKRKLLKAMQKLGKYNPNNAEQVAREQAVLKEALEYGKRKNILSSKVVVPAQERDKNKEMWNTVKENPDKVAKLLGSWLDEQK